MSIFANQYSNYKDFSQILNWKPLANLIMKGQKDLIRFPIHEMLQLFPNISTSIIMQVMPSGWKVKKTIGNKVGD